jgi:hypothetical protein
MGMAPEQNVNDDSEPSKEHISLRVEDWLKRLEQLTAQIRTWAVKNGWTIEVSGGVTMSEELMQRHGIKQREQPSLQLRSPEGKIIWIKPKGLWVIGANGRVDLYSPKGTYTLVDTAPPLSPAKWRIHRVGETKGKQFSASLLKGLV